MTPDEQLVADELAHLDAVQPGEPDGFERAYVRAFCLRRLRTAVAAAVLRQELLFKLAGEGPWYGPDAPMATWYTERNRIAFLAGVAGCRGWIVPSDVECRNLVMARRRRRIEEWNSGRA